jgi:hypothetical protein
MSVTSLADWADAPRRPAPQAARRRAILDEQPYLPHLP